jgi:hypothetical protein
MFGLELQVESVGLGRIVLGAAGGVAEVFAQHFQLSFQSTQFLLLAFNSSIDRKAIDDNFAAMREPFLFPPEKLFVSPFDYS